MEHEKILNILGDASEFRTRKWVEINSKLKAEYDNNNIRFKMPMLRLTSCDYSNAYMILEGTVTVPNMTAAVVAVNNTNKKVIFGNCAPFTNCWNK